MWETQPDPPEQRDSAVQRPAWVVFGATAGFVVVTVAYLVWFFSCEYVPGVPRYYALTLLLVPDQLVADWFGGGAARLAVLDRLPVVAAALGIWLVAFCLGRLALQVLAVGRHLTGLERTVFSLAVGLSLVSTLTLALGLAGLLQARILFWLVGLLVVGTFAWLGDWRGAADGVVAGRGAARGDVPERPWWRPAWWWALLPFVAALLLGAMLPPVDFDVLEYHLQVPKEWYEAGRVTFLPHNIYGNMPLGGELLATTAMAAIGGPRAWWWGALAGKLLIAGFAVLTSLGLYAAGQRFFSRKVGAVAALLYLSTPWIAQVSVNGLIDGVLACYGLLAVFGFKLWWDEQRATGVSRAGLVALVGLLAGTTAATKYTGVVLFLVPLGLAVPVVARRQRGRLAVVCVLAAMAGGGLWYAKNAVLAGNPTYPLLYRVFGGATRTAEKDAQWRAAHEVPRDAAGRRYSISQARGALLQVGGRSRWNHPLLVPLGLMLVFCWRDWRRWGFWLLVAGGMLAVWWVGTHRIDRFWLPALPFLTLLAAVGSDWTPDRLWRGVLLSVLAAALLVCFAVNTSGLIGDNRYFVALAELAENPRFSYVSPMHLHLNDRVRPDQRVLLVGDAAVFHLRMPVLYSTCFDGCVLEQLIRGRTAAERRQAFAERGIAYVYVDWAEIRRYRETYGFSDYVSRRLLEDELVRRQGILDPVAVPGVEPERGTLYRVRTGPPER